MFEIQYFSSYENIQYVLILKLISGKINYNAIYKPIIIGFSKNLIAQQFWFAGQLTS